MTRELEVSQMDGDKKDADGIYNLLSELDDTKYCDGQCEKCKKSWGDEV